MRGNRPERDSQASFDGEAYQARFDALAASGMDVHGEVDLVLSFRPTTVLDAGCGTGRVAIELDRRGIEVVGVDVDLSMLAAARRRSDGPTWVHADLSTLELGRQFDVVVLAGNVPLFCPPSDRSALVGACARHVAADGVMVAGFQLDDRYALEEWDGACRHSGLELAERWATWNGEPFVPAGAYAVSVHRPTNS